MTTIIKVFTRLNDGYKELNRLKALLKAINVDASEDFMNSEYIDNINHRILRLERKLKKITDEIYPKP